YLVLPYTRTLVTHAGHIRWSHTLVTYAGEVAWLAPPARVIQSYAAAQVLLRYGQNPCRKAPGHHARWCCADWPIEVWAESWKSCFSAVPALAAGPLSAWSMPLASARPACDPWWPGGTWLMEREIGIRRKLHAGQVVSVVSGLHNVDMVDYLGQFGFDGVWIECE